MRILLVSDFVPPVRGGLEFHVEALASELANQGHHVDIATLTTNPSLADGRLRVHTIEAAAGYLLPHVDADRPFHPPLPDPLARRGLRKVIEKVRPDVIHGHSWLAVSLPRKRPPFVFTAHDYGMACSVRTLLQPDLSICSGPALLKCVSCASATYGKAKAALTAPGTIAGRHLLQPDEVVAVSARVAKALQPYTAKRIRTVHNFVTPAPSSPEGGKSDLDVPPNYVMFAGDAGAHKGLRDLLTIWEDAEPPAASLLVATTRPADITGPSSVKVVSLTRPQVNRAWSQALLAVIPSRWEDPCPTVALEALRAGLPVVAYATGGIPELVRDGQDGLLFPVGDVAGLKSGIVKLIQDPDLRAQMAASSAERGKAFLAPKIVAQLVEVYQSALESRRIKP